jgi:hypothetical protein
MDKNELKAKYGRIANDPSQLEMFKDDVIDGKVSPLPETPVDPEDKTYTLRFEDGEIKWSEGGSGPAPAPVVKGDIIFFGEHEYRVLDATSQDNVKVMLMDKMIYDQYRHPSIETTTFDVDDTSVEGIKYDGSTVDACANQFIESLTQDIQDAIHEADFIQSIYEKQEVTTGKYRYIKRGSTTAIRRKAHLLSLEDVAAYLNVESVDTYDETKTNIMIMLTRTSTNIHIGYMLADAMLTAPTESSCIYDDGAAGNIYAKAQEMLSFVLNVDLTQIPYLK